MGPPPKRRRIGLVLGIVGGVVGLVVVGLVALGLVFHPPPAQGFAESP